MITVNWQHIILDETAFTTYNTHRVARARERARAAGHPAPFPVVRSSPVGGRRYDSRWSPLTDEDGQAPASYPHGELVYDFGFWSINVQIRDAREGSGPAPRLPPPSRTLAGSDAIIDAKAWYIWNLGGGPGPHGIYLDAFDVSLGDFIPNDFVEVEPDDTGRTLTAAANNGFLSTEKIDQKEIKAMSPIGESSFDQREFLHWLGLGSLSTIEAPEPPGSVIIAHQSDILQAYAFYERLASPPLTPINSPREAFFIIGNLADGPYIIFGPGGAKPVGPWDPTITLKQVSDALENIGKDLRGRFGF